MTDDASSGGEYLEARPKWDETVVVPLRMSLGGRDIDFGAVEIKVLPIDRETGRFLPMDPPGYIEPDPDLPPDDEPIPVGGGKSTVMPYLRVSVRGPDET